MIVEIKDIAVINRQRKNMSPDAVKELAADIAAIGLLHPPVIRKPYPHEIQEVGECKFVLMAGGRRLAAHVLLGRKEIEVKLKDDLTPIEAEIAELSENIKRVDISWDEEASARKRIFELLSERNPASTLEEIASEIGISKAQLSKDVAIAKAVEKDATLKGATSKGSAIRIATYKADINQRVQKVQAAKAGSDLGSKLVTADGRDFIRQVPSQSVDLVFSDLPYGIDYFDNLKGGQTDGSVQSIYDDSAGSAKDFIADIVPHALRVVKPTGWVVFFMCYEWHGWLQEQVRLACPVHAGYAGVLDNGEQGRTTVWPCNQWDKQTDCKQLLPEMPPWIWTRRGKGNHGHWPELHASNRYEMLVVVNGGQARLAKKPVENVLDFPPFSGERHHAMQKPHDLCREIIERTTVPGERVLDVCFGSGAHLAAAADLGRDFLGCEKNPDLLPSALTLVGQYYRGGK